MDLSCQAIHPTRRYIPSGLSNAKLGFLRSYSDITTLRYSPTARYGMPINSGNNRLPGANVIKPGRFGAYALFGHLLHLNKVGPGREGFISCPGDYSHPSIIILIKAPPG